MQFMIMMIPAVYRDNKKLDKKFVPDAEDVPLPDYHRPHQWPAARDRDLVHRARRAVLRYRRAPRACELGAQHPGTAQVEVRVGDRQFDATARVVHDDREPELTACVKALSDAKYGWSDGLVVELTPP